MATLISADDAATSAEEIYGSLQHIVKPILEKISLSTPTGTASLQPAYFSLVPTSLKKWYRRWLLLTFSPALKYSPGNGGTGCRSPHRVRSSTAEGSCMFSEMRPRRGRDPLRVL